ncbi:MAG: hypothetical protein B7X86_07055 [Sphingobacteriales bacterium 17-39-43]|uniref:hypothetical protein n=1 Tax=Daejeonella sp. TaxID=2805397 RepID=UPI000BDC3225|nr:hypothetical protein [Daejeonella sp.]OYZ31745.1 MAG: hypothetical protein B7Y24_07870 [Sphingobacteriales bacterium 16-39-50]OZA25141.1 MAG: hypothetical protein B7X86_07055 [Sphingobacteriales bacterium 17-39-43]HQT22864.1 lysylphosphatidylglycerol synthase domain-containing protein [Daejeonella sp.]HQT57027.1 lysylphosphatidylglycerol synthase domain-containing protein [Daejeonella sp.]
MNSSTKKILSICIKVTILGLASLYIYNKLNDNSNIKDFKELLNSLDPESVVLVISSLFLLMFLNWFLEALKWKFLVQKIEVITKWKAVESVFCGLTWAVFTPNRIGEFGGRVFFLSPNRRIKGAVIMTVGTIGQMVLTNVLGLLALSWFLFRFMDLNPFLHLSIFIFALVFSGYLLLFFFNIHWINGLLSRIQFLKRYRRFLIIFSKFKFKELLKVLIYCFSRILVFSTQYFLVFRLLIPEIYPLDIVLMMFVIFFVQSSIPSLDLFDLGIRATTAAYFFSFVTDQEIAVMAAVASIWLINLIIPAILGSVFVLKLNFFGSPRN